MGNANLFKGFTRLKIQDNATPAKQTNTEVRSIVRVSIKVPVRKYSRTHAITSEKSRIKKIVSFDICDKIQYNIYTGSLRYYLSIHNFVFTCW
jgi:hypothetical protein